MPAYHARVAATSTHIADGTLIVNVFHLEVDTLTSPPNWVSIATDIDAWLRNSYLQVLSTNYRLEHWIVTDENYPGSTHGQGAFPVGAPGTRVGADQKTSPALCALATFKTNVAKRYARGHMFLPPADSAAALATGSGFAPADLYIEHCQSFIDLLKAGHGAGSTSYVLEIFSRKKVAEGDPQFSFPVITAYLQPNQHWLRSRTTSP